jgi:phage tail-like protein
LDRLYVACPGLGQVLVFTTPDLNLIEALRTGLQQPTWVAADGSVAIVVSDPGAGSVVRIDPLGRVDTTFQAAFALPVGATSPACVAVDADGVIYLACAGITGLSRFTRDGQSAGSPIATESAPQALAVAGKVLYVADETSGHVRLYRLPDGVFIGSVEGFQGPVSAIAVGSDGELYLKTGVDDSYVVGTAAAGCVPSGTFEAGPLDAGEDNTWYRLAVATTEPAGTSVDLETYLSTNPAAAPGWMAASSLDELLSDRPFRYLWVRLTLRSADGLTSPRLLQVEAETPGDSYLEHLPAVYARDATSDFLERLLDLAKSVLGDLEAAIAALPRLFDPKSSPAVDLPWLAGWLAFDVPPRLADLRQPDALRNLIGRLHSLYKRRGTPAGVSEFVEIYTGVRPHLIESFRERGIWVLGETSALGFDTALPRTSVDGLIVDESAVGATTLTEDGWGWSLFEPTAHRFTVLVPAASARDESSRRFLRDVIEQQKPAHTDFHLCFTEPTLRIGIQSRLGVDAIIAGPPQPTPLGSGQALDRDLRLADDPHAATGAVQRRARIGIDTRLA